MKAEWKCVTKMPGELSVMICGMEMMPQLYVDS